MKNLNQLNEAKKMLSQILVATLNSAGDNKSIQEAKCHIQKAIVKIDIATGQKSENTVLQEDQWWNGIMTNAPFVNITPEQADKAVNQLDTMIDIEKSKISEIDNKKEKNDELEKNHILND